jgi:hypothetical protein
MDAIYRKAVVQVDGSLQLDDLPFLPGETVELIVQVKKRTFQPPTEADLKKTVILYGDTIGPVTAEDWEALGLEDQFRPGQRFHVLQFEGRVRIIPEIDPQEAFGSMPGLELIPDPEDDEDRL